MQYKYKKKLYKILFIVILLSFIVSLVGCDWFSLGLLNIFDPQAQIRVDYRLDNLTAQGIAEIWFTIFSLNEVEFIGEQFLFEYYNQEIKIPELSRTIGATFYVPPYPLSSFENPVKIPKNAPEDKFPVYFQDVIDYMKLHPLITEITSTITVMGTDGARHSISKTITFDLPALLPGIDFTPPVANIATTPGTPTGDPPLSVVFDASGSTDVGSGIASYSWDFGDGSTGTGVVITHTFVSSGTFIVILTVTDFYGNEDIATKVVTVGIVEVGAKIDTTPSPAIGFIPFTVGFDASRSTVASLPIVSYVWAFTGGSPLTATGVTAVSTFLGKGTYLVKLTVTDSAANVYVAFVTVIANP